MEGKLILSWGVILCISITVAPVHGHYYSSPRSAPKEKITNLHFFLHDRISGNNPTAVLVANAPNETNPFAFGSLYAVDDPLTVGPDPESEVIGNAQGVYVSLGQDTSSLVVYLDFGFTSGEFNGSSISMFSRNPLLVTERELAVVGGREKLKMARGFAQLRTHSFDISSGNAIVEYHVTLFHH